MACGPGIDLFVGFVIGPTSAVLSIPARAEFASKFMPMMVLIMPTLVVMTLAAGFQVAVNLGNLNPDSVNHAWLVRRSTVATLLDRHRGQAPRAGSGSQPRGHLTLDQEDTAPRRHAISKSRVSSGVVML